MFTLMFMGFIFYHFHYLSLLLVIEILMLYLFIMMSGGVWMFVNGIEVFFVFLTLMVCGGSLGLSLLVSLSRSHGCDLFSLDS